MNKRGYTLVETLVVIGLFTVISFFVVQFFLGALTGRAKAAAHIEVQEQARAAAHWITHELRQANALLPTSDFGVDLAVTPGASLDVSTSVSGRNPTSFFVVGGNLQRTYALNGAVDITSNDVSVTHLIFSNLSSGTGLSKQVRFTITVQKPDPLGGPNPTSYTLTSTVELRGY